MNQNQPRLSRGSSDSGQPPAANGEWSLCGEPMWIRLLLLFLILAAIVSVIITVVIHEEEVSRVAMI
jgi:hypothetical protein